MTQVETWRDNCRSTYEDDTRVHIVLIFHRFPIHLLRHKVILTRRSYVAMTVNSLRTSLYLSGGVGSFIHVYCRYIFADISYLCVVFSRVFHFSCCLTHYCQSCWWSEYCFSRVFPCVCQQASSGLWSSAGFHMPIYDHFFRRAILTRKLDRTDLVLDPRSDRVYCGLRMQCYKSLCAAVVICTTLINMKTYTQTHPDRHRFPRLIRIAQPAGNWKFM